MQDQRQEQEQKQDQPHSRLALQFTIGNSELVAICNRLQTAIIQGAESGLSTGMIAVTLIRIIKEAIDLKFENKQISAEHLVLAHDSREPELNKFKANIVRGMFLTFIEHKHGLPGLFEILGGIAAAGLGIGSFCLPGSDRKIKLSELAKFFPKPAILRQAQIELMQKFFVPERLAGFASARLGLYSMLTGCSLLPFYAASATLNTEQTPGKAEVVPDLQAVSDMVTERFSPESERLKRFLAQNLFVVMFEELFTHESTVFSIFAP